MRGGCDEKLHVGCMQVSIKTRTQVKASSAAGGAAAAAAEPGDPGPCAKPAVEAGVAAQAGAAALMASPRLGLHTSRHITVERSVEVAVLGPGDLAGDAAWQPTNSQLLLRH